MTVIGYDWRNRDIIRRERANGYIAYPSYVESGCDVSIINPDQIDIASGVFHAGSFRTPIAADTITRPVGVTYYVYAVLTAQFDGFPRLTNVINVNYEVHTTPQTFIHPKYGVLIAVVGPDGTSTNHYVYAKENLGLPVQHADYFSLNQKTVGPVGCDYDNLAFALIDAPDDTTLVCYPGADYNINRLATVVDGKRLRVVAAQHIDPRNFQTGGEDVIIITTGGPFVSTWAASAINSADLYFKGFEFDTTHAGGLFYVGTSAALTFDSCRINDTSVASGKTIQNDGGGRVSFLECWCGANGNDNSLFYEQTLGGGPTAQFFCRESTFFTNTGDGVYIYDGSFIISESEFLNASAVPGKRAFSYQAATPGIAAIMRNCYFNGITANTTGFRFIPGDPTVKVDMLGCVFRGEDATATALDVVGGIVNWDSACRIFDDTAQVIINPAANVSSPRTPVFPWETVSLEDLTNVGALFQQNEPMGFVNQGAGITLSEVITLGPPDQADITLTPTGPSFDVWSQGLKYTFNLPDTVNIPVLSEGFWFVYYDAGAVLTASMTPWDLSLHAPVTYFYWDATNQIINFDGDERHSQVMDWADHLYNHLIFGLQWQPGSGLEITPKTTPIPGTGNLDADAEVELSDGVLRDEDFVISVTDAGGTEFSQDLTPIAQIPVFHRDGANGYWRKKAPNNFPLLEAAYVGAGTRIYYNDPDGGGPGIWGLIETGNNNHMNIWLVGTNNRAGYDGPVIAIAGQAEYNTSALAEEETWSDVQLGAFFFQEMRPLYRITFQTANGYTNLVAARITAIQDFRSLDVGGAAGGGAPTVHNSLGGRTDPNAHPATAVSLDTTLFNKILSPTEDNVQLAIDEFDDVPKGQFTFEMLFDSALAGDPGTGKFGFSSANLTVAAELRISDFDADNNHIWPPLGLLNSGWVIFRYLGADGLTWGAMYQVTGVQAPQPTYRTFLINYYGFLTSGFAPLDDGTRFDVTFVFDPRAFGNYPLYKVYEPEISTASLVYVPVINDTHLPYLPAGNYFVDWSYEWSQDKENEFCNVRLTVGGTVLGEQNSMSGDGAAKYPDFFMPGGGVGRITWAGGANLVTLLEFSTSKVAELAYLRRARVRIWMV